MENKPICKLCKNNNNVIKKGKRNGKQRYFCKVHKQHVSTEKKTKPPSKSVMLENISIENLEKIYLNWCMYPENYPEKNAKWASIILKTLQCLDPKYANSSSKTFTPEDYGKFVSQEPDISEVLEAFQKADEETQREKKERIGV